MPIGSQALNHVAAHAAQTNHSYLHKEPIVPDVVNCTAAVGRATAKLTK